MPEKKIGSDEHAFSASRTSWVRGRSSVNMP